jgi:hypothetical protein
METLVASYILIQMIPGAAQTFLQTYSRRDGQSSENTSQGIGHAVLF